MTPSIEIACVEHLADMVKESKSATPGTVEKYAPWYGAATLGAAGNVIGQAIVPPEYKALGALAGTLVGTGAGVHGGEAVGRAVDKGLSKKGAAPDPEEMPTGPQEPDYNQTLRDIAKRKALVTAKEIGAIALPTIGGLGAGVGYEKFMKSRGRTPAPLARKLMTFGGLPMVGATAAMAYRAAKDLKENEFVRIREEELAKYDQAMRDYHAQLQRNPQPEGLT
jgi:hypothetical protein